MSLAFRNCFFVNCWSEVWNNRRFLKNMHIIAPRFLVVNDWFLCLSMIEDCIGICFGDVDRKIWECPTSHWLKKRSCKKSKKSYSRVAAVSSDEKECAGCQIGVDHFTNPGNPQNTMCSVL